MDNLTVTEIDIQIAATRAFDYMRDLLLLAGSSIEFDRDYQYLRIQFGDAVVQLVQAIRADQPRKKRRS